MAFPGFLYGITIGWSSPAIFLLTSIHSPLPTGPITMEEASWITSLKSGFHYFWNSLYLVNIRNSSSQSKGHSLGFRFDGVWLYFSWIHCEKIWSKAAIDFYGHSIACQLACNLFCQQCVLLIRSKSDSRFCCCGNILIRSFIFGWNIQWQVKKHLFICMVFWHYLPIFNFLQPSRYNNIDAHAICKHWYSCRIRNWHVFGLLCMSCVCHHYDCYFCHFVCRVPGDSFIFSETK